MDKSSISTEKKIVKANAEPNPSQSCEYVNSVRMTPERLLNAVIKNSRQGGKSER